MQRSDARIRPALISEHKGMTENDAALFKRKWEVSNASSRGKLSNLPCSSTISRIAKLASTRRRLVM